MSYNGIGLSTSRGTGTNGYVQKNLGSIRPSQFQGRYERRRELSSSYEQSLSKSIKERDGIANVTGGEKDILSHQMKRGIDMKCMLLQDSLEEDNEKHMGNKYTDEEISQKVEELRIKLLKQYETDPKSFEVNNIGRNEKGKTRRTDRRTQFKASDTHLIHEAKRQEAERFRSAFNMKDISKESKNELNVRSSDDLEAKTDHAEHRHVSYKHKRTRSLSPVDRDGASSRRSQREIKSRLNYGGHGGDSYVPDRRNRERHTETRSRSPRRYRSGSRSRTRSRSPDEVYDNRKRDYKSHGIKQADLDYSGSNSVHDGSTKEGREHEHHVYRDRGYSNRRYSNEKGVDSRSSKVKRYESRSPSPVEKKPEDCTKPIINSSKNPNSSENIEDISLDIKKI